MEIGYSFLNRRANEEERKKKAQLYQDMVETLEAKRQRRLKEKEMEAEENRKYLEFIKKKEEREEHHRAQKAELEAAKYYYRENL